MTTTARTATRTIATVTAALFELAIIGVDFETCELCGHDAVELFDRIDNRDGCTVGCCEHCANTADVSHVAD